jgi:hypothetical protein
VTGRGNYTETGNRTESAHVSKRTTRRHQSVFATRFLAFDGKSDASDGNFGAWKGHRQGIIHPLQKSLSRLLLSLC